MLTQRVTLCGTRKLASSCVTLNCEAVTSLPTRYSLGVVYYVVWEEHVCLHVVRLCAVPMSPHWREVCSVLCGVRGACLFPCCEAMCSPHVSSLKRGVECIMWCERSMFVFMLWGCVQLPCPLTTVLCVVYYVVWEHHVCFHVVRLRTTPMFPHYREVCSVPCGVRGACLFRCCEAMCSPHVSSLNKVEKCTVWCERSMFVSITLWDCAAPLSPHWREV